MVYDNQHLPVIPKQKPYQPQETPKYSEKDKEELADLMAKLQNSGLGNNRFFSANDLKGMNAEELNAYVSDMFDHFY
jgi:ribosomal protein L29